jgi:hypothetical protein
MKHFDKSKAGASRPANRHDQERPAWCEETLVSLFEAAGHPSLSQVILGPSLYAKARALAAKAGMTTSDLALAVIWFDIADDEEVRATFRSPYWFIPAARRIVKLASQHRKRLPKLANAQRRAA